MPLILVGSMIALLELRYPYHRQWQADIEDICQDSTFMVVVQMVLPMMLSFLVSITLVEAFKGPHLNFSMIWPHTWPVLTKGILMLLIADFFDYWVHRYEHHSVLWRFHAVHHSPHKLYWINVGRFHPIEKMYQYLVVTLPFLVMGVQSEVLSIFLVIYGINGFFQHCNIDLKLGPLNYLFSGPELHRWHHSRKRKESSHNFGNTLIIYDILFGTYFLPVKKTVENLGLNNANYTLDFWSQIKQPFIIRRKQHDISE